MLVPDGQYLLYDAAHHKVGGGVFSMPAGCGGAVFGYAAGRCGGTVYERGGMGEGTFGDETRRRAQASGHWRRVRFSAQKVFHFVSFRFKRFICRLFAMGGGARGCASVAM